MAEAVVSIALERLADVVQKRIQEEVNLVSGVKREVRYLSAKLKTIRNVLDDAERRRYKDKTVHNWLRKLEDVSYDIDDVLDEWNFAALKLQIEGSEDVHLQRTKVCPFIPSSCLFFNKVATRRDIAKKIKGLKERLNEILNEKDEFGFVVNQPVVDPRESTRVRSVSLVEVSDIHGRGDDKESLTSKLIHEAASQQGPQVISIVGVGGIGKTTLAQLVYNDDRLVNCFQLKLWVCVSDVFDEVRIANSILESVKKESSNLRELESLLNLLKDSISGKTFLIVLDDVWTEDYNKWEPFKNTLNYGAPGSKILVTTRSERVARMMGTTEIHRLGQLSDTDCWLLMKHVAFHGRSEEDYEELKEIGKKIANKCKGLPLAAKVLGSLLRFKDTKKAWENVLESEIWQLEEAEVELFPHLFLSYNELSPTMKRCFSYCSIFPKDLVIDVQKLIRMWMDLGYLSSTGSTNDHDLELRGKEYFNNLRLRSFFQDIKEDGDNVYCKMHDIVHDIARFLRTTGSEESDVGLEASNNKSSQAFSLSKVYRSLYCQEELSHEQLDFLTFLRVLRLHRWQDIPRGMEKLIHLRYLDASGRIWSSAKDVQSACKLYNLQTLYLSDCKLKEIPRGIKNLTQLRYLVLSYNKLKEIAREIGYLIRLRHLDLTWNTDIVELPETICNLCDLEILNLNYCYGLIRLPEGINGLVNLRHLYNIECTVLHQIPQGIGKLTGLRTLNLFHAGNDWSKLGYLKELDQLSGSVVLNINLHDRADVDEAWKAKLMNKIHIKHLDICFSHDDMGRTQEGELLRNEALEALQPPRTLHSLSISNHNGTKFPNWMISSYLNHLRDLHITRCNILTLPCLGRLPELLELSVSYMTRLSFVGREFLGLIGDNDTDIAMRVPMISFPKLKVLRFEMCLWWTEWEDITAGEESNASVSIMPCLRELDFTNCGLRELPHRLIRKASSLQHLSIHDSFHLSERYEEEGSAARSLFSHIPRVTVVEHPFFVIFY